MPTSTVPAPAVEGVCTHTSGWQMQGAGPSCTFVGRRPSFWQQENPSDGLGVLVAGCARGIADVLSQASIPTVNKLCHQLGGSSAVYVFDDDPLDTRQRNVLQRWAASSSHVRLFLANEPTGSERIQRLAMCRNTLVHEARNFLSERGVLLMLDLDCRFPGLTHVEWNSWLRLLHGVNATFGVLVSNNPGAYRDMWALRSTRLGMAYDCFWDPVQIKANGHCKAYRVHVHPSLLPFDIEAGFDGAAVYSARALRRASGCQYVNESDGHVVSEHVPFQQCLRRRGVRIGLAPWFMSSCSGWKTKETAKRIFLLPNGTYKLAGYTNAQEKAFRLTASRELGSKSWAPWGTNPSKVRGWY